MTEAAMFETEVDFTLPLGYVDADGALHREGTMRRATAADEILPLRDPRVQGNPAYLVVILLSRVVTHLGGVGQITPRTIEGLFATDLAYLQDLYNQLNGPAGDGAAVTCPQCRHEFTPEAVAAGGSFATPSISSWGR
jgi:hypothetical protein